MGSFHLTKMSFRNLFKKPATKMYPVVQPQYYAATKGRIVNDIKACILCGICENKCPTHAIVVDKPGESWTIDPFNCVVCLTCVSVCPKKCLTNDTAYTAPALGKSTITVTKPELTEEEKAAKEAAEVERAAKIAAAKAAKAAKDAAKDAS